MEDWQDVSTYSDSLSFLDKAPPHRASGISTVPWI